MEELNFTVHLVPRTKKNSMQVIQVRDKYTGKAKPMVIQSKAYLDYEKAAMWCVPKSGCINEPVNVRCLFYMPTRHVVDLTNLLEAIDDIMVKAGLLEDDNYRIVVGHDGSRVLYDKEHPRTEVTITPIE